MKKALVILTSVVIVLGLIVTSSIAAINPVHTNGNIHDKTMKSESSTELTLFTNIGPGQHLENNNISSMYADSKRWRQVILRPEVCGLTSSNTNDRITLNLFDDTMLTGYINNVETNVLGTQTISGSIDGSLYGKFIITITGHTFLIMIVIPEEGQFFIAHSTEDKNLNIVVELCPLSNQGLLGAPPLIVGEDEKNDKSANIITSKLKDSDDKTVTTIDVMIIYTRLAKDWASGRGGIANVIASAIENGQIILENSQTYVNLNLVHAAEVDYNESESSSTDLNRLIDPCDGYMDEIHEWRDTYGADLVQLLTYVEDVGGIAALLTTINGRPDRGFSIVRVQQAATTYTSIHEFGHNMGCHHHKQQNMQPGPTNWINWPENLWSAGWRWNGTGNARYCTVMTYQYAQFFPDDPYHALQVPYFSNPNINCGVTGLPMGHSVDGDNARTIREIRQVIAAYREQSFVNYPPYQPHMPMPRDEAIDVSMPIALLSWYAGDANAMDQINYTIYFGAEPDPPFWGTVGPRDGFNKGPLTADLEILLDPETTYYWKISAEDSHGATSQSPIWSFTTGPVLWDITQIVSTESTGSNVRPSLAVDSHGTVHVAWDTHNNILYKYKSLDGGWSSVERVSTESSSGSSKSPTLVVDSSNTVHIAWHDRTNYQGCGSDWDIFYKYKPLEGSWSTTQVVSTESINASESPSLAVDAHGTVHVAWQDETDYADCGTDTDIFYKSKPRSSRSWTEVEVVSTESTRYSAWPSLAVDNMGTVHVAWQDITNYGGSGSDFDIFYKCKPVDGSWTEVQVVSSESDRSSERPSLVVDGSGTVHVAWGDFTNFDGCGWDIDIFYKYKPFGGSWSTTKVVSTESTGNYWWPNPSLFVDIRDTVHVAWADNTNYGGSDWDNDIFYKYKPLGGGWSTTQVVSTESTGSSESPSLAVDNRGTIHVAWDDWTFCDGMSNIHNIFYKTKGPPVLPVVTTKPAEVGYCSARLHGSLASSGGQVCQIRFRYRASGPILTTSNTMRWTYISPWHGSYTTGQSFHEVVVDLGSGVTYEFQAGARNVAGEVWGDIVKFTTLSQNQPPFAPADPFPANNSIDMDVFSVLAWSGGDPDPGDMVTYDVYFGSSNPPEKQASNQSDLIYTPSSLTYDTTYYWRIVAWDNHGSSASGPLWIFTTIPYISCWSAVEVVSTESIQYSGSPSMAVDNLGAIHIAWQEQTNIFYKYKPPGGDWSAVEVVSTESTLTSKSPTLFVDSSRTVHVAWEDTTNYDGCGWDTDIFYKYKPLGGNWTVTEVVSIESTDYSWNPSLFVDDYGIVHIAWEDLTPYDDQSWDSDIFYTYKMPGGSWSEFEVVSTESLDYSGSPSLFVDTLSRVHVAWVDYSNYNGSGTDSDIFYKYKFIADVWPNVTEVVSTESSGTSLSPSLAVDSDGTVHVAWHDYTNYNDSGTDSDIFYKYKPVVGVWSNLELVSTESTDHSWTPSLAVDNFRTVHIAWEDTTNYEGFGSDVDIFYKYKLRHGVWSMTEVVSTVSTADSWSPSLAVEAGSNVHVSWHDNTNYEGCGTDYDIFYRYKEGQPPLIPKEIMSLYIGRVFGLKDK